MAKLTSNINVQSSTFKTKNILLKTIPAKKVLSQIQIERLQLVTKFAPKFCVDCIQKLSSPELFHDCQNKFCEKTDVRANLETDLLLFQTLPTKQFKTCKVETARFCQFCRKAPLNQAEVRLLNQLIDRRLGRKSVAIIESQRTKRAENLGAKLMPRALAIFSVISENVTNLIKISDTELCGQLNYEIQEIDIGQVNRLVSRTAQKKYGEYNKVEIQLRKLIFQENAIESLLYGRKQCLKTGISFKASQYTEDHLAGLLKLNF